MLSFNGEEEDESISVTSTAQTQPSSNILSEASFSFTVYKMVEAKKPKKEGNLHGNILHKP